MVYLYKKFPYIIRYTINGGTITINGGTITINEGNILNMEGDRYAWQQRTRSYERRLAYIWDPNTNVTLHPIGGEFLRMPTVTRVINNDGVSIDLSVKIKQWCIQDETNFKTWKRLH